MTRPAQCIFRLAADAEHSGAQKHVESGGGVTCVTVQALLKTMRLLCITASAGRSRSVKNAADTKLFAAPGLAKSKYRRFSRPTSTAMHKRRSRNQVGLNCN